MGAFYSFPFFSVPKTSLNRFSRILAAIMTGPIFGLLPFNAVFMSVSMFDMEQVNSYMIFPVAIQIYIILSLFHLDLSRVLPISICWCLSSIRAVLSVPRYGPIYFVNSLILRRIRLLRSEMLLTNRNGMFFQSICRNTWFWWLWDLKTEFILLDWE